MNSLSARKWLIQNAAVLAGAFVVSLIVYIPLVTGVVLTNHTIPNVLQQGYPSYRTFAEARWLADLVLFLSGSQGNQFVQALAGFALTGLNGVILADIVGVKTPWARFGVAALVALHPVLLDYYSFTSDNIGFTLGDTLILVGAKMLVDNGKLRGAAWGLAGILYFLGLSTYAPKVAVIGLASIAVLAAGASRAGSFRAWAVDVALPATLAAMLGVALFCLVAALLTGNATNKTEMAPVMEMLRDVVQAYPVTVGMFWQHLLAIPLGGGLALVVATIGGAAGHVWRAKSDICMAAIVVLVIALIPVAIQSPGIVSERAYMAGRIFSGWSYATAFLGAGLFWLPRLRVVASVALAWLALSYATVASQEASAMAMKNIYETALISRIVGRAEELVPYGETRALMILGDTNSSWHGRVVANGSAPFRPHLISEAFAPYRQVEIANFFAGRTAFRHATITELEVAREVAGSSPAWPQAGSVFAIDDMIVVLMDPLDKSIKSTWTK